MSGLARYRAWRRLARYWLAAALAILYLAMLAGDYYGAVIGLAGVAASQ